jgi:hypothetical protein
MLCNLLGLLPGVGGWQRADLWTGRVNLWGHDVLSTACPLLGMGDVCPPLWGRISARITSYPQGYPQVLSTPVNRLGKKHSAGSDVTPVRSRAAET